MSARLSLTKIAYLYIKLFCSRDSQLKHSPFCLAITHPSDTTVKPNNESLAKFTLMEFTEDLMRDQITVKLHSQIDKSVIGLY